VLDRILRIKKLGFNLTTEGEVFSLRSVEKTMAIKVLQENIFSRMEVSRKKSSSKEVEKEKYLRLRIEK